MPDDRGAFTGSVEHASLADWRQPCHTCDGQYWTLRLYLSFFLNTLNTIRMTKSLLVSVVKKRRFIDPRRSNPLQFLGSSSCLALFQCKSRLIGLSNKGSFAIAHCISGYTHVSPPFRCNQYSSHASQCPRCSHGRAMVDSIPLRDGRCAIAVHVDALEHMHDYKKRSFGKHFEGGAKSS